MCAADSEGQPGGADSVAAAAEKVPQQADAHGMWQGLTVASSTVALSTIKCFKDHFYNEINLRYIHYGLRELRDGGMPAALKAAALGGSVGVLRGLLEACPGIMGGTTPDEYAGSDPLPLVALHAVRNAAAHGRVAFLRALFEGDLGLRGDFAALKLAAEGGHTEALRCLLGYHGAAERRVQLGQGRLASLAAAFAGPGRFVMLASLADMTEDADGLDGQALQRAAFQTDDYHLTYGYWQQLGAACKKGTPDDLRVLLQHRMTQLAVAAVKEEYGDSREHVLQQKMLGCANDMMNSLQEERKEQAAESLRLLLHLPLPDGMRLSWHETALRAATRNWAQGLRVLLFDMPPQHEQIQANASDSRLFRQACCQNCVDAAEMLLSVEGPHAVDPRARHQAAMRTACWRNMPRIVALLLRQRGERAVRMQVGKRSFFWGALRPHYKHVHKDYEEASIAAADARMDDQPGGYCALKLLLGATGISAVPPRMWAHGNHGRAMPNCAPRGPVERQYRDVGWGGGVQRMARREMVLARRGQRHSK